MDVQFSELQPVPEGDNPRVLRPRRPVVKSRVGGWARTGSSPHLPVSPRGRWPVSSAPPHVMAAPLLVGSLSHRESSKHRGRQAHMHAGPRSSFFLRRDQAWKLSLCGIGFLPWSPEKLLCATRGRHGSAAPSRARPSFRCPRRPEEHVLRKPCVSSSCPRGLLGPASPLTPSCSGVWQTSQVDPHAPRSCFFF